MGGGGGKVGGGGGVLHYIPPDLHTIQFQEKRVHVGGGGVSPIFRLLCELDQVVYSQCIGGVVFPQQLLFPWKRLESSPAVFSCPCLHLDFLVQVCLRGVG